MPKMRLNGKTEGNTTAKELLLNGQKTMKVPLLKNGPGAWTDLAIRVGTVENSDITPTNAEEVAVAGADQGPDPGARDAESPDPGPIDDEGRLSGHLANEEEAGPILDEGIRALLKGHPPLHLESRSGSTVMNMQKGSDPKTAVSAKVYPETVQQVAKRLKVDLKAEAEGQRAAYPRQTKRPTGRRDLQDMEERDHTHGQAKTTEWIIGATCNLSSFKRLDATQLLMQWNSKRCHWGVLMGSPSCKLNLIPMFVNPRRMFLTRFETMRLVP